MGDIKFTMEQQQVIDARDCDLLVSAAAGSGKTAVLVERIIQLICDEEHPVDIDKLLVVTFTNAAAAQMREKISKAINKKLREQPLNEHLERQAALVHNAQITTIDSFCLFVIRNNFNDIGLDPGFRIGDEGEMKLLKEEALAKVLEQYYGEASEDFIKMTEALCLGSRDLELEELVKMLYDTAMSYPWPKSWLREHQKDYELGGDLDSQPWFQMVVEQTKDLLEAVCYKYQVAEDVVQKPDGPYFYGELITAEREVAEHAIEELESKAGYEDLQRSCDLLQSVIKGHRLPSKKDDTVDPEKRDLVKKLREEIKKAITGFSEKYLCFSKDYLEKQMAACDAITKVLCQVTESYMDAFSDRKREKNVLDFNDIEHMALDILVSKEENQIVPRKAALEYQKHFAYVMIDEYQDSNLVQEYLLASVSRNADHGPNRFMVGDVKQSIYKFRLARPELFLEKYEAYHREENRKELCIDLHQNFRSRWEVLDATNYVFACIMGEALGGIVYDDKAALKLGASYPEKEGCNYKAEILLYQYDKEESELSQKELEALGICKRIKQMIGREYVTEGDGLRPVRYGDIVILLRSASGYDEIFARVLEEQGIPAYVTTRTGYFSTYEIRMLLHFLRIIDNPMQDIPLYGVLTSHFGKLTDEEMAFIRASYKEGSLYLYDCVKKAATQKEELPPALGKKLEQFETILETLREKAGFLSIHELLLELLAMTEYEAYVAALSGGQKRLANVTMFLQKALDFEKTSFHGLYHFIRYMDQLEKYDVDYGEANTLGEASDVVRIMSIHKSKGLEFPVCIVAGMTKKFNYMDCYKHFLVEADLGIGMYCQDGERRTTSNTLRRQALSEKMKQDTLAEELRVLYVAMTRAKEKLILTGVGKQIEKRVAYLDTLTASLKPSEYPKSILMEADSMMDWILMAQKEDSPLELQLLNEEDVLGCELKEEINRLLLRCQLEEKKLSVDEDFAAKIEDCFQDVYSHRELQNLPAKTSVSELKHHAMMEQDEEAYTLFHEREVASYLPKFVEEKSVNKGIQMGNAYHKFMELYDFAEVKEKEELQKHLEACIERYIQEGFMPKEYQELLYVQKLMNFMNTPVGEAMQAAHRNQMLYREKPFVLGIPASQLSAEIPENERVLIQGIIDVFWQDGEDYYLLDYKTDKVSSKEELISRYKEQIHYYKQALMQMHKPVKKAYLYSFSLEEIVEI